MNDITKKLSKYSIDEEVLTEATVSVRKTFQSLKDISMVLQEIHDLKSARVSDREKKDILEKNIEALNYILRGKSSNPFIKDVMVAVIEVSIRHAGFKVEDTKLKK